MNDLASTATELAPAAPLDAQDIRELEHHAAIPVAQLARANQDHVRAEILLTATDHMMLSYGGRLGEMCASEGFEAGANYCAIRLACLFAPRTRSGLLFPDQRYAMEQVRHVLMKLVEA